MSNIIKKPLKIIKICDLNSEYFNSAINNQKMTMRVESMKTDELNSNDCLPKKRR